MFGLTRDTLVTIDGVGSFLSCPLPILVPLLGGLWHSFVDIILRPSLVVIFLFPRVMGVTVGFWGNTGGVFPSFLGGSGGLWHELLNH